MYAKSKLSKDKIISLTKLLIKTAQAKAIRIIIINNMTVFIYFEFDHKLFL